MGATFKNNKRDYVMTKEKLQAMYTYCNYIYSGCTNLVEISKALSKSDEDKPTAYEINIFVAKVAEAQNKLEDFINKKYK